MLNEASPAEAIPIDASDDPMLEEVEAAGVTPEQSASARSSPPYPPSPATPTQEGPRSIRYDFNFGARILLPKRTDGQWRVTLRDLDSGNILFQSDNKGAFVCSSKRYYVRFGVQISDLDDCGVETEVFSHSYDARGRDVIVLFPIGTLGDTMGWFPYAARFAAQHGCRLTCALSPLIIPLFRAAYPHINLVTHEELVERKLQDEAYATYRLGLFFDDKEAIHQPTDFRLVGLHRTAGYILGVDPAEAPPAIALDDASRPIAEPYVCIAVQSSSQAKYWNNPRGWRDVVAFLKQSGFRVICIDQKNLHGTGLVWNHIPHGAEDETGDRRWPSVRAGCTTPPSSSACPPACPGWPMPPPHPW